MQPDTPLTDVLMATPDNVAIPVTAVLDASIAVGQACPNLLDSDGDGFTDGDEAFVGTDANMACDDGAGPPDWPPDFNDDTVVNVLDINLMKPAFFSGTPGPPYGVRLDLRPDDNINVLDINRMKPLFFLSCTP